MSLTIPKWVRVHDGVADLVGDSKKDLLNARNGISLIAEIWKKSNLAPHRGRVSNFHSLPDYCGQINVLADSTTCGNLRDPNTPGQLATPKGIGYY